MWKNHWTIWASVVLIAATFSQPLLALVQPDNTKGVRQKAFKHPDLTIPVILRQAGQLPPQASAVAQQQLADLGLTPAQGRLDARGGRWGTLLFKHPLLPGNGVGNSLKWPGGPPANESAHRLAAWDAFFDFVKKHQPQLNIDPDEMAQPGKVTVHDGGDVIQIYGPRLIDGIPVRGNYINAVINHGNLSLFGANTWGNIDISTQPAVSKADAVKAVVGFLGSFAIVDFWGPDELNIVPMVKGRNIQQIKLGDGYDYRLVRVIKPLFKGDAGRWEALVDSATGEVLAFEDTNHYAEVKGGVYPVTNDGVVPDGVEQAGWPMPYQELTSGGAMTTDTGGNLPAVSGSITATFYGPYVDIDDSCGTGSLTQTDNIDWGSSGGTDCTTPGFGGAGNTHSSRTGFYELNKIIEMARGQLPSNTWLQSRLKANMNINNTCNAFWNGTVNFYRSGGGCNNTGEIAGVFDHEWGHGMDANDATPGIASPSGEGIADIYTALRLNDSCIGRKFWSTGVCSGNGDPCKSCSGVRDIDYMERVSESPHDYTWSNANCGSSVHCIGGVYSEAVWSLWKRKLPALYGMDNNTAHEVVNRLTFIGAGGTGTWFSGGPPNGGCGGSSGYMNYLSADDDNGNLNDGTPHMQAIYEAFNDQEIACNTPTVQDSGCSNTPATAPSVTASAGNTQVDLSWTAVVGAYDYEIFRTEGVFGCDFGKVKLGETTGTTWNDSGLQNGRDYSYVVIPKGPGDACFGPASACATAAPAAGPDLSIDSEVFGGFTDGDGDEFLDNCESSMVTFDVINTGLGTLTNVRILSVTPSIPGVTVNTSFPSPISPSTLAEGATGSGSFSFTGGGLSHGDFLELQVTVTANELSSPKMKDFFLVSTETDWMFTPSKMWDFESGLDGWTVIQGTFNQTTTGGGANGSAGYVASSANLDEQCDQIRSPKIRLTGASTLSIETNFDIENFSSGKWWDRANVAVFELGSRNRIDPDGGRLYNAGGPHAHCVTVSDNGWADVMATWTQSTFSSTALGAAPKEVRIDVAYATDPAITGRGFWFDQVTVTDIEMMAADAQTDSCSCSVDADCDDGLFCNGAETCDGSVCQAGTDPCSGMACNENTDSCVVLECVIDGVCEDGEDCTNCPDDCPSFAIPSAVCGNGLCEAGDGENCENCAADCNGKLNGKPADRFCCGFNDAASPDGCGDNRCDTGLGGFLCTEEPTGEGGGTTCCGDSTCEIPENGSNCGLDCLACDSFETQCSDGEDNDCDTFIDCNDPDCGDASVCNSCSLGQKGDFCTDNSDCCSNQCKRNNTCR